MIYILYENLHYIYAGDILLREPAPRYTRTNSQGKQYSMYSGVVIRICTL